MRTSIVIGLLLVITPLALSQERWNVRGVAMGRSVNALGRGTDALDVNPAELAIPDGHTVIFDLPSFGASARIMMGLDTYKKYFTGVPGSNGTRVAKFLTQQDKDDLMAELPDVGTNRAEADLLWSAVSVYVPSVGGFGLSLSDHFGIQGLIPKDYMRIIEGLQASGSHYDFSGTDFSGWWYRELNFSYGRQIPVSMKSVRKLYAGLGIKFIAGFGAVETDHYSSSLGNLPDPSNPLQYTLVGNFDFRMNRAGVDLFQKNDSSKSSFTPFPAPAGSGFGVDIGVYADLQDGMAASFSITNIGSIRWTRNAFKTVGGGAINITNALSDSGRQQVENAAKGKDTPTGGFSTSLPTALRLGMSFECGKIPALHFLPSRLILAFDYTQGLTTSLGNSFVPRLAVGAEYRVAPFFPVRSGLSLGGGDVFRWAFGFGLDFRTFSWDFATDNFGMVLTPRSLQAASFSMGMKLRF